MIGKYRDAGLIEPWDTSRIAEFGNLNPAFLNSSVFQDTSGTWFLPTDWASTAIAWNTEKVPAADVASLNVFLDPKYAGRVSIADNTYDAWALALLATVCPIGHRYQTRNLPPQPNGCAKPMPMCGSIGKIPLNWHS